MGNHRNYGWSSPATRRFIITNGNLSRPWECGYGLVTRVEYGLPPTHVPSGHMWKPWEREVHIVNEDCVRSTTRRASSRRSASNAQFMCGPLVLFDAHGMWAHEERSY